MKYLPLYYKWLKNGMPGNSGLCKALHVEGEHSIQKVFLDALKIGYDWESDALDYWNDSTWGEFDEVRQNMLLLIAAENNEL